MRVNSIQNSRFCCPQTHSRKFQTSPIRSEVGQPTLPQDTVNFTGGKGAIIGAGIGAALFASGIVIMSGGLAAPAALAAIGGLGAIVGGGTGKHCEDIIEEQKKYKDD